MEKLKYKLVFNSEFIPKVEKVISLIDGQGLPSIIPAMVWEGNVVHVKGNYLAENLLNHELIHLAQIHGMGWNAYLLNYFVTEKDIPYMEKSSEKEANFNMHNRQYIKDFYGLHPIVDGISGLLPIKNFNWDMDE